MSLAGEKMSIDHELFSTCCIAVGLSFILNFAFSIRAVQKNKGIKWLVVFQYLCAFLLIATPFLAASSTPYREDGNATVVLMVLLLIVSQACNTKYLVELIKNKEENANDMKRP